MCVYIIFKGGVIGFLYKVGYWVVQNGYLHVFSYLGKRTVIDCLPSSPLFSWGVLSGKGSLLLFRTKSLSSLAFSYMLDFSEKKIKIHTYMSAFCQSWANNPANLTTHTNHHTYSREE